MQTISFNVMLALILSGGWIFGKLFGKIKLPSILGMVIFGILCSVFIKDLSPEVLWDLSPFLKSFALIVILLRAGLGIRKATLKKAGLTALLMSFVPCIFEGTALTFIIRLIFDFNWAAAGLTAFMLSAVSPAVVVPSMLSLKEQGRGKKNEVPTIIIAGASIDDVFAITLFSVFLSLAAGGQSSVLQSVVSVPVSILAGIVSGIILGFILSFLFSKKYTSIRATEKALILLICGTLLVQVGDSFHFASLLGLMTCGFIILEKHEHIAHELSQKLSKIWIFAEIILFVLIGFSLDIETAGQAGLKGLLAVSAGLVFRSLGVILATAFSKLTFKERLFCVIAYLPKATVQAALGGVALSAGLPEGNTVLAIAVVAILFTAPLGLLGINFFGKRLLDEGEKISIVVENNS